MLRYLYPVASGPLERYNLPMNQRELAKALTALFGNKPRRDRGVPRTPQGWQRLQNPVEPAYRRVTAKEAREFERLRRRGRSLRAIARRYGRSHHTVARNSSL